MRKKRKIDIKTFLKGIKIEVLDSKNKEEKNSYENSFLAIEKSYYKNKYNHDKLEEIFIDINNLFSEISLEDSVDKGLKNSITYLKEEVLITLIKNIKNENIANIATRMTEMKKNLVIEYIFIFGIFVSITLSIFSNLSLMKNFFKEDLSAENVKKLILLQLPIFLLLSFLFLVKVMRNDKKN